MYSMHLSKVHHYTHIMKFDIPLYNDRLYRINDDVEHGQRDDAKSIVIQYVYCRKIDCESDLT
jgi:hypothetical protein